MTAATGPGATHGPVLRLDAGPTPLARHLSPLAIVRTLWTHRDLLRELSRTSVSAGHRGNLLGRAWVVLDPLIMLAVYGFVFGLIFSERGGGTGARFVLGLYAGMLTYGLFAQSATGAAGVIAGSRNFVKQLVFPVEILPAGVVGGVLIPTLIGFGLLILVTPLFLQLPTWRLLLLPIVLVPVLLIALGSAWLIGSLGVYIPDVRKVVALVTQVGFFLTPIIWPLEKFPQQYQWIIRLNPLTNIVESVRAITLTGTDPHWVPLAWTTLFALAFCQLSYAFFMKTKRGFADVI